MKPYIRALTLFLCGGLIAACGATEIKLSVDKREVTAGGIDYALVTATVLKGGKRTASMKVSFDTTAGAFDSPTGETEADVSSDTNGEAQIKLYSALEPSTATVTASFYDDASGAEATTSISVDFVTASGDSSPMGSTLRLDCDAVNIGALRNPIPDIRVTCELSAETADGRDIPGAALSPTFRAEAGVMSVELDDWDEERVIVYRPRGGASSPENVSPFEAGGEPSYSDNYGTSNPRDGLVTLMVIVDGQEGFEDQNGNYMYDRGETFEDLPEPFLDTNDDETWNIGEYYLDTNGNSEWDDGNGQWDPDTKIFAYYKILWTGPLHNDMVSGFNPVSSRVFELGATSTADVSIANGGWIDVVALPLDRNLNPVASFSDAGDGLEWYVTGADVSVSGSSFSPLRNTYGFTFAKDASSELGRWRIEKDSFILDVGREFNPDTTYEAPKIRIEDSSAIDTREVGNFQVVVKAITTPGKDSEGDFLSAEEENISHTISGTAD